MVGSTQRDDRRVVRGEAVADLAVALSEVDGRLGREVAADVVHRLEVIAGVPLGSTDRDPLVLLQRRAARALPRLVGTAPAVLLTGMTADLRDPAGALLRRLVEPAAPAPSPTPTEA